MYLYKVAKGKDIRNVKKTALQDRANRIRQKGYKARVVKTTDGYELFTEAGALKASGVGVAGHERRKFS